jgi:hypothetical protein
MRLAFDLSGNFAAELQELLVEHAAQSVVIWFRGPSQKGFGCTRPISDNGAWVSRQYRLVPLLKDFHDDGHEVQLEFVPFGTITWELHQETYPKPESTVESAESAEEPLPAITPAESAASPKDEVFGQNASNVFNRLQGQEASENPLIVQSGPFEVSKPVFAVSEFDPAAVIKQNRGGRPRKWNSDAERKAYERAMKAKEPVTVHALMTGLPKPPSRTVSQSLLQQRVREQENKCLLCQRDFGTFVTNGRRTENLRPSPDHFEPWSLRKNNDDANIFAVDQVCNSMKRDFVFKSLPEARAWMEKKWDEDSWRDGFTFAPFRADLSLCSRN